jgi:hypothetical protein
MATYSGTISHRTFPNKLLIPIKLAFSIKWHVDKRLLLSLVILLLGVSIPILMVFAGLPVNFPLCFLGFALTACGGTFGLVYRGE